MVLRNGHRLKTTTVLFDGGNKFFKVIGVEYVCENSTINKFGKPLSKSLLIYIKLKFCPFLQ